MLCPPAITNNQLNTNMTQKAKNNITIDCIVAGAQIEAGQYIVSVSRFDIEHIAIKSKRTGDVIDIFPRCRKSKRINAIRRKFKAQLISPESRAYFGFMSRAMTVEMIEILRSGK